MKIANQNNYPNDLLGYGTGSIKSYGCTLACLSAISGIEILKLNEMLKGTSFTNSAFAGSTKNLINWTKLSQFTNGKINFIWRGYGYDEAKIKQAIEKNGFCLIEVLNGSTKHWIVAIGNKKALDPLTGGEISTSKYPSWTGWSELEVKESMPTDLEVCMADRERFWKQRDEALAKVTELEAQVDSLTDELTERKEYAQKLEQEIKDHECDNNNSGWILTGKKTIEDSDGNVTTELSYKPDV